MTKHFLFFFTFQFLFSILALSQVIDDFSSNGFNLLPQWEGDVANFSINPHYELQLNAMDAGSSALWVCTNYNNLELEWKVRVRMDFSPSNNNFSKIYLLCDSDNLHAPFKRAFYLQFGENGSADAIELFYETPTQTISICRGEEGLISNSFTLDVKVLKNRNNIWQIWVAPHLDGNYHLDAYGSCDSTLRNTTVGLFCQYTSTNKNKFFFDDFYFGPPWIDTLAPTVHNVKQGVDYHHIEIEFSEKISTQTALKPENYSIVEWQENPIDCQFKIPFYDKLILTFSTKFSKNQLYHLSIKDVSDNFENTIVPTIFPFSFHVVNRHQVVINEILADPFPIMGLPPVEYVELYNCTDSDLVLSDWIFQYGLTKRVIPEFSIKKDGYALLVPISSMGQFADSLNLVPLSLLNITDAGQNLTLFNEYAEVMHNVNFSKKWHDNPHKAEGGWSLEMIDYQNPCLGKENWNSSTNESGGTPGKRNSIATYNPDLTLPEILKIVVVDTKTVKVFFSETILLNQENFVQCFQVDRELIIESVEEIPPENSKLIVRFSEPLRENVIYTLKVRDTICDCAGNRVRVGDSFQFGLPKNVEKGDLVINEILSNPFGTTDGDFVEIYNRSDKIIDLKTVRIGSGGTQFPDKSVIICTDGYNLFPHSYLAVCKNPQLTMEQYYCPFPKQLLFCDSLPNFPNTNGTVHLTNLQYNEIDKLIYDESMHYTMLQSVDGVSLERLDFNCETQNQNNWKSASQSAGFATPGYVNSQYSKITMNEKRLFADPEVFSPNNDGFDDYTRIYCDFPETENRIMLQILDKNGNLVKTLANNLIVSYKETFVWDGTTDKNQKAPPDLYVVKLQYWNLNGKIANEKAVVGVVMR